MMKRHQKLLRLAAALLCTAVMLASMCTGALAADTFYWRNAVTIGSISNPGNVLLAKYQLYDPTDTIRPITTGKPFATSIGDLLATCGVGSVAAAKDGFFASEADALQGIVKLTIDVVGRPPAEAIDVLYVLDESGSMTMYSTPNPPSGADNFQYTVPCLNPDHYYEVKYQYRKNGTTHMNQTYELHPNDPLYKAVLNVWEDHVFYDEIKRELARIHGVTFAGVTLENWLGGANPYDFGAHHFDQSGAPIPKRGSHNNALNTLYGLTGYYYSPPFGNAAGCVDRQLIAKTAIRNMVQQIASKNTSSSRVGYVSFAGGLGASVPLVAADRTNPANPYPAFTTALNALNGYDNTNYAAGLNEAYRLLNAAAPTKPAGRHTYVVFITDGMPNTPANAVAAAEQAAANVRGMPDTTLYCVGIKSQADSLLQRMSTGGNHFKECDTQEEFEDYLAQISSVIRGKAALMMDVMGDAYDLVCDATHPISVQQGTSATTSTTSTYSTLAAAAADGLVYNTTTSTLNWQITDAHEYGNRVSFYVKLHEPNYLTPHLPSYEAAFDTNRSATVSYLQVSEQVPQGTPASITLPNPATIKIQQSRLTAVKTSNRLGETVRAGEGLTYIITVTNTGKADLTNVVVSDDLPAETTYVPGSGGTFANNRVTFRLPTLAANRSADVSFQVRIAEGTHNIVNYAMFGTAGAPTSLTGGQGACYANLVENPRAGALATPKTGDHAQPLIWALLALSAAGCIGVICRRRRRNGA